MSDGANASALEQKRLRLEWTTLIFAGITMVGVLIYTGVTIYEWREMHESTVISQRAWVGPPSPAVIYSLELGQPGSRVNFTVPIRNFGQSVALHVVAWAEMSFAENKIDATVKETCANATSISNGIFFDPEARLNGVYKEVRPNRPFGNILFPGQEMPMIFAGTGAPNPDSKQLMIIGCIVYKDQFGTQRRTRFCFGPPADMADPTNVTVPSLQDRKLPATTVACNAYNDAE
jgi:hypothetical protein